MYQGKYNGKKYHEPDIEAVLARAWDSNVHKIIITGGNLESSKQALELTKTNKERLYSTVGVHPTRCSEFENDNDPEIYMKELLNILNQGKQDNNVVAVGECGLDCLDYDRTPFCDKETQKKYFDKQFLLVRETKLPMFLHCRAAVDDFIAILTKNLNDFHGGVVHSFTGTPEEALKLLNIENLYIGINGCSLKTIDNLNALKVIPIEKMMIETDCPYCQIKNTHAGKDYIETNFKALDKKKYNSESMVKGRNEPCTIKQVLEVIGAVKGIKDLEELSETIWNNTIKLFSLRN